ncbi:hypothetical protein CTI12_AA619030 [Artemisia annua]|uniref:Reverse transcriptase zinc-binding domain-containing protein n=1 Tax=Artemisia annua TaxID=35608 RepID=A0A2U1KCG1_ARTAN|nr:hypothetical protein CTI12_AA619030 [Artemisia annua]
MHEKGIVPHSSLKRRVNNGISTKFWTQTWIGNTSLQHQFPRLFRLATNKDCTIRDCWNNGWVLEWSRSINSGTLATHILSLQSLLDTCSLNDSDDTWTWSIGNPSFTVKATREHIDHFVLPDNIYETRWNRFLPKKINIFIWRVLRDRLPTRWNLSRKGIDLDTISCPICDSGVESIEHILWFCSLATSIWHRVFV